MRKTLTILLFVTFGVFMLLPLGVLTVEHPLTGVVLAFLACAGWGIAFLLIYLRYTLHRELGAVSSSLGLSGKASSIESSIRKILEEVKRKNAALSTNVIETKITTKEELSKALERIVAQAFKLLYAESAELALFDKSTGAYHTSFVLGKPFRTSAQAMLSGAADSGVQPDYAPDVLVHPIAFAGNILGSLRVALKKGRLPTQGDVEIMKLLVLQSSIAVINGEFVTELLKMKQVSDETVKVKTGFLANLSHELRGPLGIMMNAVELVLDELCGPVTEDQRETLKMVSQNGQHLLELVNDVLDYAKVESGRITVNKVDIPLDDLLVDIGGVVRGQADQKKHKLVVRSMEELVLIPCDRRHARQMLINMLTNAIKYTPDGGHIEVWAERIPGNKVKINVKDSGVGIDPTDRSKVFAAFERIENAYSMKQIGTGLGMPLTKRLAEVNGASIDFSSAPGQGSHFWLIFPVSESTNPHLNEESSKNKTISGQGRSLLIVAENDGERAMITRYLSCVGFTLTLADTREQAEECLHRTKFDLIVVDNNITDTFKFEIAEGFRSASSNPSLPIILLSSRAFVFDIQKQLRLGVDRYLTKPIRLEELGRICQEIIHSESRVVGKIVSTPKEGQGTTLRSGNKETLH